MRPRLLCLVCSLLVAAASAAQSPPDAAAAAVTSPTLAASNVDVRLETSIGAIVLRIDAAHAPVTAANFLRYVDQKRLDGSTFYRATKVGDTGEYGLVQGGLRGNPKRIFKPIEHEPTTVTGLSHLDGAVSMARAAPGTASADFFIVTGNLTTLDATQDDPGYAVFGRVIEGMDVVHTMLELPRLPNAGSGVMRGEMLAAPVVMSKARRADNNAYPATVSAK